VNGIVLLLLRTLYGLVQSASSYWREMCRALEFLGFSRSKADPCLHFKYRDGKLHVWLTWVDDCAGGGPAETILDEKEKLKEVFDCDDIGEMDEYVGCKVDIQEEDGSIKITCPMILKSFEDEFGIKRNPTITTPAKPGSVLARAKGPEETVSAQDHHKYRSGVGKLSYLAQWSRPDILNAVRLLSMQVQAPTKEHMAAMRYAV